MKCSKCQGLMAVDSFIDLLDDSGQLWISAWRCLNCGQIVDPGIVKNARNASVQAAPNRAPRMRRRSVTSFVPIRLTA
jgi:hypothetical protein